MKHSPLFVAATVVIIAVAYVGRDQLAPYAAGWFGATQAASTKGGAAPDVTFATQKSGGQGSGRQVTAVVVAVAKAGPMPIERKTIGVIVPFASTALTVPSAGIVAKLAVADGAIVKMNDLIVQLNDQAIRAALDKDKATMAKDQASLDNATKTYQRTLDLVKSGTYTAQAGDDALAAVRVAAATLEADKAQIAVDQVALDNTKVLAPFDGQLGSLQVSKGAFLAPGAAVATLNQMKPVLAEFTLSDTDLFLARTALADGQLTISVAPILATVLAPAVTGPVVFIDNAITPSSGTFRLRANLQNTDGGFWPGQSLDVTVIAGQQGGLVIVPTVAVKPQDTGFVVYVVKSDATVEVRPVTVAMSVGDRTGLSAGLADGERVVTEGQLVLTNGAQVQVVDGTAEKTAKQPTTAETTAP